MGDLTFESNGRHSLRQERQGLSPTEQYGEQEVSAGDSPEEINRAMLCFYAHVRAQKHNIGRHVGELRKEWALTGVASPQSDRRALACFHLTSWPWELPPGLRFHGAPSRGRPAKKIAGRLQESILPSVRQILNIRQRQREQRRDLAKALNESKQHAQPHLVCPRSVSPVAPQDSIMRTPGGDETAEIAEAIRRSTKYDGQVAAELACEDNLSMQHALRLSAEQHFEESVRRRHEQTESELEKVRIASELDETQAEQARNDLPLQVSAYFLNLDQYHKETSICVPSACPGGKHRQRCGTHGRRRRRRHAAAAAVAATAATGI